jgi:hypothetical protein
VKFVSASARSFFEMHRVHDVIDSSYSFRSVRWSPFNLPFLRGHVDPRGGDIAKKLKAPRTTYAQTNAISPWRGSADAWVLERLLRGCGQRILGSPDEFFERVAIAIDNCIVRGRRIGVV